MEESDLGSVLRTSKKKKIKLEEIDELYACGHDYNELTAIVGKLMQESIIQPVKASKTNGKYPPLFKEYKITVKQQRDDKLIEEMRYRLSTRLDMSYYLKHYEQYVRDREYVTALSSFLDTHQDLLAIPVSGNERRFEGLHKLQVFVPAYLKMLEKAEKAAQLPDSKENQNDNIADIFMTFFEKDAVEHMYKILGQGQRSLRLP